VSLKHQIEPYFFADVGKGKLKQVQAGEKKDRFLASLGGGVKIRLKKNFFLRLEWAQPVGNRPTPGSGPSTFHISFQTDI
jgi:hemolysin activation/secretion protein